MKVFCSHSCTIYGFTVIFGYKFYLILKNKYACLICHIQTPSMWQKVFYMQNIALYAYNFYFWFIQTNNKTSKRKTFE